MWEDPKRVGFAVAVLGAEALFVGRDTVGGVAVRCWQIALPMPDAAQVAHRVCTGPDDLPRRFEQGLVREGRWEVRQRLTFERVLLPDSAGSFRLDVPDGRPVRYGVAPLPEIYRDLDARLRLRYPNEGR